MQTRITVKCVQGTDEIGDAEEFTNDLTDVVEATEFAHIGPDGLPRVGSDVKPGMVLIGKIGQRRAASFARARMNEVQLLAAAENEVRDYYRSWLYDGCAYVPMGCVGIVVGAWFEKVDGRRQAVVEIECT